MVGATSGTAQARGFHPPEVRPVCSAAAADDVLPRCAPEPDHHVPALAPDHPRRRECEGQDADEPARRQHGDVPELDAGQPGVRARAEHVHLVAAASEARGQLPEVGLGAPAAQAPVHDGDAHQDLWPRRSQSARRR